jgi:hypothetical protein
MATQVHGEIVPEVPPYLLPPPAEVRPKPSAKAKKKLIRRTDHDCSQLVRRSFQGVFLLLNVWIGGIFYFGNSDFVVGDDLGVAECGDARS